ncbi:MAG: hypothetical protein LC102_00650 [Ignavibacteriales bacterium]|jgi:hypothetical protein|nr:MAG: hypothetical protein F9K26_03630 [Ignavibacteriaceae bacterium]MBW7872525.1 hypothetical protein [Ignavibacteria bacterium]MCZ2141922.1 hypothetical protein [Ignavibacteriales bacterium]OQY79540.1 MAG: hypothetical protein B6D45_00690 [Ignavibacteriales bacterium UTCHB3]MBV6445088.1 hypothetical protein [Ignavibacteriaceae bacterium]
MKKTLLKATVFSVFLVGFIMPQGFKVDDTLNVVILQKVRVPEIPLVLSAITKVNSLSAEILNSSGASIQKLTDELKYQKPSSAEVVSKVAQQQGRGVTVQTYFEPTFKEPGKYYLKFGINVTGEANKALVVDKYYLINVTYPTIAAPVSIRNSYFFSENPAFSFAVNEYTNQDKYSFKIFDGGSVVEQGVGSFVNLSKILNDPQNVGKVFKVEGYYNNDKMTYIDPTSNSTQSASWEFTVQKPGLGDFCGWAVLSDKEAENEVPWYISVDNQAARQFLFGYFGNTENGFVFAAPKFNQLRVTSEPDNFVQSVSQAKRGLFPVVEIVVNPAFLDAMDFGEDQEIRLTIQFTTQFGEKVVKKYRANVIK